MKHDEVDADVDIEAVKMIMSSTTPDDHKNFQLAFSMWFTTKEQYELDKKDISMQFRAMLLVIFFSLLSVKELDCDETVELIPVIKKITTSPFLSASTQAMAAILFGFSKDMVRNGKASPLTL